MPSSIAASVCQHAVLLLEVRIFLDANVLFSAARSDGVVRRLLNDLVAAGHVLCADGYIAEEARRNLAAKAPQALTRLAPLLDRVEGSPIMGAPLFDRDSRRYEPAPPTAALFVRGADKCAATSPVSARK